MYKLPAVIVIAVLLVVVVMASLSFTLYDLVGLRGRVDRALEAVEALEVGLVFTTNSLFIQIAYTEHLRGRLEQAEVDYEDYGVFLGETLFSEGELDDLEYLYTYKLDLEALLAKTELGLVSTQVREEEGDRSEH